MNSDQSNSLKQDKVFVLSANQTAEQSLRVGDTFLVEIESNPSTGYRWVMTNRKDILKCIQLKKEQTFPATSSGTNLVGAPGKQQWQLMAKCVGETQIRFEYRRPWEAMSVPAAAKSQLNLRLR